MSAMPGRRGSRRRVPRGLLVVSVLVLLVAAGACRTPVTAGVSTGARFLARSPQEQSLELAQWAQADARWVRITLDWSQVQGGGPDSWDWAAFDGMVQRAEEQGLQVLALPMWTPAWANGGRGFTTPPDDPLSYARFVQAERARYRPGGTLGRICAVGDLERAEPHRVLVDRPRRRRVHAAAAVRVLRHPLGSIRTRSC